MAKITNNLFWNIVLTISGYVFPFLTFPYVTRVLGAESLGYSNFLMSIVDYAILFSTLGVVSIGYRYIPQCNNDVEKRNNTFNGIITLHILLSILVLIIYVGCVLFLSDLYQYKKLLFIGAIKIVSNIFLVEWLFQGLQEFKYVTIRALVVRSLYVLSIFIFIKSKEDVNLYFILTILQFFCNSCINCFFSRKFVSYRFSIKSCRKYLYPVFSMGLNKILLSFYGTFNIMVLGFTCGNASVGFYTTATKLYAILLSMLEAYNGVFVPYLNTLKGKGDIQTFLKYISLSFTIVGVIAIPLIILCVILAPDIILLIAGPGYERSIIPFQIIIFQLILVGFAQILENQILLSFDKFKEVLVCTLSSTILSISILFSFVKEYGEIASAVAVAVPHVLEFILLFYYTKKTIDFKFPLIGYIKHILACIPIVLICYVVKISTDNRFFILFFGATSSLICYFLIQLYVIKTPVIVDQVKRLLKK